MTPNTPKPSQAAQATPAPAQAQAAVQVAAPKVQPVRVVHHPADLPVPQAARRSIYLIIGGVAVLLAWASVAEIDHVTRAPAQIIAADRTQIVQSAESGVVTQMHVKEGEQVKAGQLLVTMEKERTQAAVADSRAKVAALRITVARLQAEVYNKPLQFDKELQDYPEYIRNQTDLYNKRQTAYQEDIRSLEKILRLARSELEINMQLLATGDVSRAEILRLQRSVAEIEAQIANKRNKYFQDAQAEMTKAQEELNTQSEQLRDRSQLLEHTELKAPTDGMVNNIRMTTLGAVVRPGDVVLELSPTGGDLIAEAKVSPADIAFIAVGQSASVKLDAYDSSIFGSMKGQVSYISPDVLTEETRQGPHSYYRLRILIKEMEFQGKKANQIHLRPGLSASVDIKAMDRTVLSYLTKPITKTLTQSMGER
ncbi:HlyD family efflux transporter periplasmic adaptor subunit [Limnohabitans sp.]|uniref:HlyD family efflux transporter periplasmic adaptor subunit n=1 Tax=Limnohabitans sp. TaxID=1907725 RepID=UPI00289C9E81|nr:HlyD family efflux transporter periplasmic adaptor subunit [Limnohabitans sp.]